MMYVDPTSQYKFVAKTAPNVPPTEPTSPNIGSDAASVSIAENTVPTTVLATPNDATHFQAPEHLQKQTALLLNAGNVAQPGQVPPVAGQTAVQGQAAGAVAVAGPAGQGLTYDGKRMRKSVQRRTVDYNSSVIRFLETRKWFKSSRNQHALQPEEIYNVDVVPPCGYIKNPMNAVTTKFVRTSTNKLRCPIFCVVWTPEGRRLVTGASSGEFTLWNGLTFNFETILQAHDRAVRSMVWSHNDSWLLTGDHGGFVKYWQSNMNNVRMYEAHKDPVRGLSFSPSDNKFASCSDDGLVKVWDFYRCAEERELKGHGADVKCVDWHPSKGIIVSGSKDSQQPVKLWDPKSGNSITTLHCHKSTVMTAKWNSNGNWLVTGSRDHLLKLFDIRMMKELQTFRGHKKEATVVAWHPVHETMFASGGSDGSLMFWLTGVDEKAGAMDKAHEGIVWSLSWHPLGHILCSGSNDHTSKFWARNRPGDVMTDKYNMDIQGSQEDGEYSEEGASQTSVPALAAYDASAVIPGVGLPVTAGNVVLPDSKDVDAHLYGESSKDNRKTAVSQPSTTVSSEFPYPPAFKQATRPTLDNRPGGFSQGKAMIPGLDMPNTDGSAKQENEGYNIPPPMAISTPQLRLPMRLPNPHVNPGNRPPPGNRPFLANHPNAGNHPRFGPGPRHSFDFHGPPGMGGQDPNVNFGPSGPFPPNQFMRFPGPRGIMPEGPRGGFGQRRPSGPHPGAFGGPHHYGPHGGVPDPHMFPDGPHRGPRPLNVPPGQHGHRGPPGPNIRSDGPLGGPRPQNIPPNQHGYRDGAHRGPRPLGSLTGPNIRFDGPHEGPRPHNISPSQHGHVDGPQEGSNDGPNGHHGTSKPEDIPGQLGPKDSTQGVSSGPPGLRNDQRPRDSTQGPRGGPFDHRDDHGPRDGTQGESDGPPGPRDHHGPRDSSQGLHGGPSGHRDDHGPREGTKGPRAGSPGSRDNRGPREGTQGPRGGPFGPRDDHALRDGTQGPRGGPPGSRDDHGARDGTQGLRGSTPNSRDDNGPREGTQGRRSDAFGPRDDHGPRDGTQGSRVGAFIPRNDHGPRDGTPGPRSGPSDSRDDHGPREGTQGPRGDPFGPRNDHGPREGSQGSRGGPPPSRDDRGPRHSSRDDPNFGPPPRAPRPLLLQQSRTDQQKPEIKSPEGDQRRAPEARENFRRRSRDNSPRDSPPVLPGNHVKQERRTSDPDAPGILGDYVAHVKEMQRGILETIVRSATGQSLAADMAPPDRLLPLRPDNIDRPRGPDLDRPTHHRPESGRTEDRTPHDRSDEDRRGDRPPRDRQDMGRPGNHERDRDRPPFDRPAISRREDRSPHDRSDMGPPGDRPRDRPSFEGRPGDRSPKFGHREDRGVLQDRPDMGQPGRRPSFDRQGSGRQSDRPFVDNKDLPASEKPGLLPIPDMFLALGPPPHDGPPRDSGSANHRQPEGWSHDRRRDHGRFQDTRNESRPDKPGFDRGHRDHNSPEVGQGNPRTGAGRSDGPLVTGETNIKPLMSLLDAPPVSLGSPPGQGGVENRGRKRILEHEFDRPPKRMSSGDNRERLR